ncbi:MAG: hypothetical protein QXT19_02425 [Candidatus Woesearchaeota archaeon]
MRDRVTIKVGRLWHFPSLIPYVLINTLDILALFINPKTYVAYHSKSIVSFCCIKRWGKIIEIGNAYTMPRFRKQGHFKELMHAIMRKYRQVYILTHGKLVEVSEQYGFKRVKNPPLHFRFRKILAYLILGLFYRPWVVLKKES